METNISQSGYRAHLKALSAQIKEQLIGDEGETLNQVLIERYYTSKAHHTFKSLNQWNNEGFNIKKGAKPFPIWGKPVEAQSKEVEGETYTYFPLRFLFSNAQVWKGGAQ
jgi:hypothetical protein